MSPPLAVCWSFCSSCSRCLDDFLDSVDFSDVLSAVWGLRGWARRDPGALEVVVLYCSPVLWVLASAFRAVMRLGKSILPCTCLGPHGVGVVGASIGILHLLLLVFGVLEVVHGGVLLLLLGEIDGGGGGGGRVSMSLRGSTA